MKTASLAPLLQRARKAQRLTQLELQDLSGVSATVIYKLESGRTDIALGSLLAVAEALGIHLMVKSPLGEEVRLDG